LERRRSRLIQDLYTTTRPLRDVDAIKPRVFIPAARANHPYLAGRQRIAADAVLAVQLGCGYKLFHTVLADRVTELSVSELSGTDALLLLLNSPATFQR